MKCYSWRKLKLCLIFKSKHLPLKHSFNIIFFCDILMLHFTFSRDILAAASSDKCNSLILALMEKFPYCRNRHSSKECQASGYETSDTSYLHDKTFTDLKKSQMLLVEATCLYYKSLFGGIIPCASCPVSSLHVLFEFSGFQISLLNFEPFSMYFFFLSQLLIHFPGLLLPKHSASIVSTTRRIL